MCKGHLCLTRRGRRRTLNPFRGLPVDPWNGLRRPGAAAYFRGCFVTDGNGASGGVNGRARRRRHVAPRCWVVKFRLSEDEYAMLSDAARRGGWACGAYAARTALAAAQGTPTARDALAREALTALIRASGQLARVGVNLNQAVARLNSTGQYSGDLAAIAAYCARVIARLDEAALDVRKRLP